MADIATVAQELQAHLISTYGFAVHDKESSPVMQAVGFGMDIGSKFVTGLPTGSDFMTKYATTLATDVYLPASIRNNPLSLCEVVTHECQHTIQFTDTNVIFAWFYLTDGPARAQFEADAYASGIAVRCWLTGGNPPDDIPWVVQTLVAGYHLKPEDGVYAEAALKSHFASVASGIYMTRAGRTAIDFLESKYPELKGTIQG